MYIKYNLNGKTWSVFPVFVIKMREGLLLFVLLILAFNANAQNYLITFSGTGGSGTIDSIKVENLTTGEFLNLNGEDILRLSGPVGIPSSENEQFVKIKIYPNPMQVNSIIEISPPVAGDAIISVLDLTGKVLTQLKSYLENYKQEFSISGIKNGLHIINVRGNGYQFSGKVISNGKSNGTAIISRVSSNIQSVTEKKSTEDFKGVKTTVNMAYNSGERLKYTSKSGYYSTVVTDIPTSDNTVTFTFTECKDGDNNFYPVIEINSMVWMAENLKTTKYRDGSTEIMPIPDNTEWSNLTAPGYSWYNNNEAISKNAYGALYNWYTVSTGNLCPAGWHVPTDAEWTILENFLIANGYNYDGTTTGNKIAKSIASTIGWTSSTTTGAVGNTDYDAARNASGFTTIPGGYRDEDGTFNDVGKDGGWWSATETSTAQAKDRFIYYNNSNVIRGNYSKKNGFSVRCLKD